MSATAANPRHRPLPISLEVAAELGRLPDELTADEVLALWQPHRKDLDTAGKRGRMAADTLLREALADGGLPAHVVAPHQVPRPHNTFTAYGASGSDWGNSLSRDSPAPSQTITVAAVYWIRQADALAWFKGLDVNWWPLPADCLLRRWWPLPAAASAAPATVPARRYAKRYLDELAQAHARLGSWRAAYREVSASSGISAAALKKARSDASPKASKGKPKAAAKAKPALRLVRSGEK